MRIHFFNKWSDWKDLSISCFDNQYFLLQARRNQFGRVQFRVERTLKKTWGGQSITLDQLKEVK